MLPSTKTCLLNYISTEKHIRMGKKCLLVWNFSNHISIPGSFPPWSPSVSSEQYGVGLPFEGHGSQGESLTFVVPLESNVQNMWVMYKIWEHSSEHATQNLHTAHAYYQFNLSHSPLSKKWSHTNSWSDGSPKVKNNALWIVIRPGVVLWTQKIVNHVKIKATSKKIAKKGKWCDVMVQLVRV